MKKSIFYSIKVLKSLIGLFQEYQTAIDASPLVKEITDMLPVKYQNLMDNVQIQAEPIKGVTKEKRTAKEQLCKFLYPIMTLICNEAYKTNKMDLASQMKTTYNKLMYINAANLIAIANEVKKYCEKNAEALPSIGIKPEMVEQLNARLQHFEGLIGKPLEVRARRKVATENLDRITEETNRLLHDRLIPLMESIFAESNPELLAKFQEIVQKDKVPSRKVAVMGRFVDDENDTPIEGVWLEIPNTHIAYRSKGAKGYFRIQNLEPGSYELKCTQANYHPFSIKFSHAWGQTTRLQIRMKMTEIAKNQQPKKKEELVEA